MNKILLAVEVCLLLSLAAYAGTRSANAYRATKLSTTSVLVSCSDEREPVVHKLENTTVIVVTCSAIQ
jgi:hypothetical protein